MKAEAIGVLSQGGESGDAIARAIERAGRTVVRVRVDRGPDVFAMLSNTSIQAAFLALSGPMAASVRGALELLRIPYTGSSSMASYLSSDKLKTKELLRLHNVPTPPYYQLITTDRDSPVAEKHGSFGFPVMVKPRRRGMGLASRANNLAELTRAMERAFCHDDSALVERYIGAQPIAVAILEGKVLGAVPKNPAPAAPALSPTRYRGVLNLAEQAARALETSGPVLVDVLVTEGQNEYVLEVDAAPNLTQNSVFSRIARADGLSFGELCEAVLSLARLHTRILASANPSSESPVVRTVHAEVPARRLAKGSDLSWRRSRTA